MEPTVGRAKKADIYSYGKVCGWILFGDRGSTSSPASLLSLSPGEGEGPNFVVKDHELARSRLASFFEACLETNPDARASDMGMLVGLVSQALEGDVQ
jgi:hypothetical protein